MRPSWPAPTMPTRGRVTVIPSARARVSSRGARVRLLEHVGRLLGTIAVERRGDRGMLQGQDRGGEQRGVDRSGFTDRNRRDRNAARHLHDRQQRIDALQRARPDRNADDRQARFRRRHAGQVRSAAGAGDQHLETARDCAARVFVQQVGRAMRGNDAGFERNAELREGLGGVRHRGPVRTGPHNDADQWFHRRIVQQLEFTSHSLGVVVDMEQLAVAESLQTIAAQAVALARRQGADQAEVGASYEEGLSVTVRMGELESVERQRDRGLAITVYRDKRKGSASTTDFSPASVEETVRKALSIGSFTTADEYAGLADAELMAGALKSLDLYYPWEVDVDQAAELALRGENAARSLDPRIANSEGASVSSGVGQRVYANSHGFVGAYPTSTHSMSCSV